MSQIDEVTILLEGYDQLSEAMGKLGLLLTINMIQDGG
jgi:hypothetical protein